VRALPAHFLLLTTALIIEKCQSAPCQRPNASPLARRALICSQKVTLICGERSLTYAELNARARRMTNVLSNLLIAQDAHMGSV
jgi:non-ribosomal peptide synthetase component E (peptide arylation enzyme)